LKSVQDEHANSGERFAQTVVNRGVVPAAKLAQVLSYQLCLPWVSLEHVRFSSKLLKMIPSEVAVSFGVVPVHVRRRSTDGRVTLYVATDDPTNEAAKQACEQASGLPVRMMVATTTDISAALAEEYGQGEPPTARAIPVAAQAPARSAPDTDVAAAAARMSSPDLSAFTQTPNPPRIAAPGPKEGSSPGFSPSASSPPPPRVVPPPRSVPAERSPVPGLGVPSPPVSPRIVTTPEPDDVDLEEIDELEEEEGADVTSGVHRLPSAPADTGKPATDAGAPAAPAVSAPEQAESPSPAPARTGRAFQAGLDLQEAAEAANAMLAGTQEPKKASQIGRAHV